MARRQRFFGGVRLVIPSDEVIAGLSEPGGKVFTHEILLAGHCTDRFASAVLSARSIPGDRDFRVPLGIDRHIPGRHISSVERSGLAFLIEEEKSVFVILVCAKASDPVTLVDIKGIALSRGFTLGDILAGGAIRIFSPLEIGHRDLIDLRLVFRVIGNVFGDRIGFLDRCIQLGVLVPSEEYLAAVVGNIRIVIQVITDIPSRSDLEHPCFRARV